MATAIVLYGFESGVALAAVVGVLIEVPVMLLRRAWSIAAGTGTSAVPGWLRMSSAARPAPP